jgi:hypothetical protein
MSTIRLQFLLQREHGTQNSRNGDDLLTRVQFDQELWRSLAKASQPTRKLSGHLHLGLMYVFDGVNLICSVLDAVQERGAIDKAKDATILLCINLGAVT